MVRFFFKKSNQVKHWQLLSFIGVIAIVIAPSLTVWMIINGWWTWIWDQGILTVLILAAFCVIFTNVGWWIFSLGKLLFARGRGSYRYMKVSMVVIMCAVIISATFSQNAKNSFTNKPLIALVGPNPSSSIIIACYTANPQSNLILEYNLKDSTLKTQIFDSGSANAHRFLLNNLQWSSTYEYHLIANTTNQPVIPDLSGYQTFKTSPRNSTDGLTFLSISDIHSAMPSSLAEKIAQTPADIIIEGGDLTDIGALNADWDGYFSSTRPIYTRTSLDDPAPLLLPVIGNHETLLSGKPNFALFFGGVGNGSNSPFYYRVDIGDIHFIVLDLEWGLESFSIEQELWLNQTFASINPADWTIVFTHCEIYSSGDWGTKPDVVAKLVPIFKNGNVDLVISGHDHHYERLIEDGITYIITGTGGPKLDPPEPSTVPGSQVYISSKHIFGAYSISGNNLDFKAFYTNGTLADSASILNN